MEEDREVRNRKELRFLWGLYCRSSRLSLALPAPTCPRKRNRAASCTFFFYIRDFASAQFRDTHDFSLLLTLVYLCTLSTHCQSAFLYLIFKILQETESDWPS